MDLTRTLDGAGIGVAIGALIVAAIACTRWLLRRRSAPAGEGAQRRFEFGPWWLNAGIVVLSTGAFLLLAIAAGPPDASPPEQQRADAPPVPATTAVVPHAQIDLGGVVLAFDPPQGYCLYPDDRMQAALALQKRVNPDNVVHTIFGDCDQLRASTQDGGRIHDFGMLMTPATSMGKDADSATLDSFAAQSFDPVKVKETAEQRIAQAQVQLGMGSFASVGMLDRENGALYYGFLSRVTAGGDTFDQATVMAVTVIRKRLVCLYLYTDSGKSPRNALQSLLGKAKAAVGQFAALNP